MNQDTKYNLFSNFQPAVFKAVKAFLQLNKTVTGDKSVTTTLRIPEELKDFYECIAQAEMTSINTAIIGTLSKVKDQTISEYLQSYTKINNTFDYQINSFLKIIDTQKIDYNDLTSLLTWVTGRDISRGDITHKEKLIDIVDKNAQLKICHIFGYNYQWLQDNTGLISYRWPAFQDRWYKNVTFFVSDLITNFYLDETVESFELSFLCCDKNVVNNIISGIFPSGEEKITPIVIANRCINGIKTRTYHKFETNDINYEKCRKHFIVLVNIALMLARHNIIKFSNGYWVTPQQHDMVLDEKLHLAELFRNDYFLSNDFCVDDLEGIVPQSLSVDTAKTTGKPHIFHCLNQSIIQTILARSDKENSTTVLTDELASKCGMNKMALTKYLRLFDLNNDQLSNRVLLSASLQEPSIINLIRIRELQSELKDFMALDTAFG